jgi:hypothetical protein
MIDTQFARDFIGSESGQQPGMGYELSFDELGVSPASLAKGSGKVGIKTKLTEFVKAARRQKFQKNPIAPNQADIVKWVIYDRFQFAPGTTVPNNFKFFTQPIGTNNKSKTDTNMDQVQRLPDPLWYNTEGIGFFFGPLNTPFDINSFWNTEYMEFWVGQKVYVEGPVQCFPGAVGLSGFAAGGTNVSTVVSNGWPRIDNAFDLRLPAGIHLGVDSNNVPIVTDGLIGVTVLQGQQFKVEMNAPMGGAALLSSTATPQPGTGLTIMCYLYGILSRGVQ